ncbi:hypothetical protein BLS_004685 [Venturia inaequalis]|uniref:Uncharacterized protein n=1 Tax=Venturia inaequalis TaxID=5025 RepID=A0A8H3UJ10_VENIN|nr:hypothetical protein BLS_004685 [Venturia inaequalis]KAE9971008.1 hypothetical protein EG328_005935 [Venturia inaequalis]KAE9987477.1 hypothetical protein EG327_003800 [Venturia inaequalis]RDI79147.1 hypothetical protein Vi05172_g10994 [Venturia inaequalis]
MPRRASKRVKRAIKAQPHNTIDQIDTESVSSLNHGGSVQPMNSSNSSTNSATPSSPPPTYTLASPSTKKRKQVCLEIDSDHELIGMKKGHPRHRDPTELPLVIRNSAGERKTLWAKMDTGAGLNVTTEKLIAKLGLTHRIQELSSTSGSVKVGEIGGKEIEIDRKITLSFTAGRKSISCKDVEFWIPRQENIDTDEDGVPDVLLGLPELLRFHMITVDPDFCNEPEEGLEVLAKKGGEEADRPMILLGTKLKDVKVRTK